MTTFELECDIDDPIDQYEIDSGDPINNEDPSGLAPEQLNWSQAVDFTDAGGASATSASYVESELRQLELRKDFHYNRLNGLYGSSSSDPSADAQALNYYWQQILLWRLRYAQLVGAPSAWQAAASVAGAGAEGAKGGASIVGNTFTFGGTDYIGLTDSSQYQGADYTVARVSAVVSREAFTTALTLGTAQVARGGIQGTSWSAQAIRFAAQSSAAVKTARVVTAGITTYDVGSGSYQVGTGVNRVVEGDNGGYFDVAVGGFRTLGGLYSAKQLQVTQKLQGHVDRVVSRVDSLGFDSLTPPQRSVALSDPQLAAAFRGNRIDVLARNSIEADRWLPPLRSNYTRGQDFVNSIGEWWDMTTEAEWADHVAKYGPGGVRLATEGK